jgi:hypothetical protein
MSADMSHVRTAVYLFELDDSKKVQPEKLGGRSVIRGTNGDFQVDLASIYDRDMYDLDDGQINRNLRAMLSMIDMSKPYFEYSI